MFSPPVYLSIGDEYDKHPTDTSTRGMKFIVPAKRNPHITDATFTPFASLAAGDPYKAVGFGGPFRQREPREGDQPPFRPTGHTKKSCGRGDYYGTFSEGNPTKHEPEFPPLKRADPGEGLKSNFYTNPSKKGTYGYTGLSIAKAGEVQYVSDPFEGNRRQEALKKKEDRAKQVGAMPFRAAVKRGGTFDESEHGFSTVYSLTKPLAPKKSAQRPAPNIAERPWVPGGALGRDITKFPEYLEDPYEVHERKLREERLQEKDMKPWHPAGNDPYRYIYTSPISYDPPPVA